MDYQDKQIVIVGAGSTGRSLARFFLARGAQGVLSDHRSSDCFDDLDELSGIGARLDLGGHGPTRAGTHHAGWRGDLDRLPKSFIGRRLQRDLR